MKKMLLSKLTYLSLFLEEVQKYKLFPHMYIQNIARVPNFPIWLWSCSWSKCIWSGHDSILKAQNLKARTRVFGLATLEGLSTHWHSLTTDPHGDSWIRTTKWQGGLVKDHTFFLLHFLTIYVNQRTLCKIEYAQRTTFSPGLQHHGRKVQSVYTCLTSKRKETRTSRHLGTLQLGKIAALCEVCNFLATLVALNFAPVTITHSLTHWVSEWVSKWAEFRTCFLRCVSYF